MPSPFPGMDPYLEWPALWPDLHQRLILFSSEMLQSQLPSGYYALIGERIILEAPKRSYYPDLFVARERATTRYRTAVSAGVVSNGAVLEPDDPIEVEETEIAREVNLEIREAAGGRVVTIIEVLSPANKSPGSKAHRAYLEKQTDVLRSNTNLVEIDLLRSGSRTIAPSDSCLDRVRPFDYLVSVLRSTRLSVFELYPRTLRESLPRIKVPLRKGDSDVVLDLQSVFQRCYEGAPYRQLIDYQAPPNVPLLPEDADWVEKLLHEKGLR